MTKPSWQLTIRLAVVAVPEGVNLLTEHHWIKWLGDTPNDPHIAMKNHLIEMGSSGQNDNGCQYRFWDAPERRKGLPSIHFWHHNVKQDEIRSPRRCESKRITPRVTDSYREAPDLFQSDLCNDENIWVIVHHENTL